MSKHYFTIEFDSVEGFRLLSNTNPEPDDLDRATSDTLESTIKLLNLMYKTKGN